jgi:hypothetical protein
MRARRDPGSNQPPPFSSVGAAGCTSTGTAEAVASVGDAAGTDGELVPATVGGLVGEGVAEGDALLGAPVRAGDGLGAGERLGTGARDGGRDGAFVGDGLGRRVGERVGAGLGVGVRVGLAAGDGGAGDDEGERDAVEDGVALGVGVAAFAGDVVLTANTANRASAAVRIVIPVHLRRKGKAQDAAPAGLQRTSAM